MAEGGHPHDGSSSERITATVDARSVECPICLDKLQQPKSLPCLHSFCLECLRAYITKEMAGEKSVMTFPCPICRTVTLPVDPTAPVKDWSRRFPTNSLILELFQETPSFCGPCKRKDNSDTPAEFWCKRMDSFFCLRCKTSHHDVIHSDCGIVKATDISVHETQRKSLSPKCPKHKKKTDLFCEDHLSLACAKCIAVDHRRCDSVFTTEEYNDKLRNGNQWQEKSGTLTDGVGDLEAWIKEVKAQQGSLTVDKEQIEEKMANLRHQIDQQLDILQNEQREKLTVMYKEQEEKLQGFLQKSESMKKAITSTKSLLDSTELLNNDIQSILVFQRATAESNSLKTAMSEMKSNFKRVHMTLALDDDFATIKQCLNLGNVELQDKRIVPDAQVSPTNNRPMSERDMVEVQTVQVWFPTDKFTCKITGVLYLSHGRLILTDRDNMKIKLVTDRGDQLSELCLADKPWNLCLVDDTRVAFTRPDRQTISFVDIRGTKLSLRTSANIKTGRACFGIAYSGNKYIVTTGSCAPFAVYTVTKSGRVQVL